jgi:hypothetical protein
VSLPRPAAKTFQDLVVWRKAHEFVLAIYPFTVGFPKPETYGLAQQLRRAAVSIPANIDILLEEVSRMLNAYATAILTSDL